MRDLVKAFARERVGCVGCGSSVAAGAFLRAGLRGYDPDEVGIVFVLRWDFGREIGAGGGGGTIGCS